MPVSTRQDWIERSRDLSQWLARTGLGDRAAFAALYDQTSPHLFAVVLASVATGSMRRTCCTMCTSDVWRSASSFDSAQSQPLTWLTSMARNRAIDSRRNRPPFETLLPAAEVLASGMGAPLSQPQRESLALAFYDGLSHADERAS